MPKLIVIADELTGKVYDLALDTNSIGRGPYNSIRIEDSTISNHHATINLNGADVTVRDLNSTNGTRVNGQRVMEAKLVHGDIVRLGRIEMRFEGDSKKASAPLPQPTGGINVNEIGSARGAAFGSTSPFSKPKTEKHGILYWVIIALVLAAVLLLGVLVVKLVSAG